MLFKPEKLWWCYRVFQRNLIALASPLLKLSKTIIEPTVSKKYSHNFLTGFFLFFANAAIRAEDIFSLNSFHNLKFLERKKLALSSMLIHVFIKLQYRVKFFSLVLAFFPQFCTFPFYRWQVKEN